MRFSDEFIANKSNPENHKKMCDDNYHPPRCSELYHDHAQTPGYPHGDGDCAPPGCDVGSVPVGEYLFDPRAANVSIDGQTLAEWYVDEYLFGPTGAGNPNISGFCESTVFACHAQKMRHSSVYCCTPHSTPLL